MFTLLQRELREYRASLLWTPVVTAALVALGLAASVILSDRLSVFGDALLTVFAENGGDRSVNISIELGEDGGTTPSGDGPPRPAVPPEPPGLVISEVEPLPPEAWNFSRDWTFSAPGTDDAADESGDSMGRPVNGLGLFLTVLHNLLLLVLMFTSANYLLGCLYDDRKDRSILFWRSMPVPEWQTVLSKLLMVALVAPGVVFVVSLALQVVTVALMALLAARVDIDPARVFDGLAIGRLAFDQVSGWIITALWLAPLWGWLLLASAAARRSPFLLAVTPVLVIGVAEVLLFGSSYIGGAVVDHLPRLAIDDDMSATSSGLYLFGPDWRSIDKVALGGGLLLTVPLLWGAVYLRRYRWEL
jgi:hypothetical protein